MTQSRTLTAAVGLVASLSFPLVPVASLADTGRGARCAVAAAIAEREHGLPAGLLEAIGAVESGNQALAVDIDGTPSFPASPASPADAAETVRLASARGARFIDVGCFQIDLRWHAGWFTSLAQAFDPLPNARAAALFLTTLRADAPSWQSAIARYHSSRAVEGAAYATRVLARWHDDPLLPTRPAPLRYAFGIRVFGPGTGSGGIAGLAAVVTP